MSELEQFIIDHIELFGLTPSEAEKPNEKDAIRNIAKDRFVEIADFDHIYAEVVAEMRRVNEELDIDEI